MKKSLTSPAQVPDWDWRSRYCFLGICHLESYCLPWNKAIWSEQSDCRISWGDSSSDTTLTAWARVTTGPGGFFFPVTFLCSAALLLLSSTRSHWWAVSSKAENPTQAGPLCHLGVRYKSAQVPWCNHGALLEEQLPLSFPTTGLWFLLPPCVRICNHATVSVIGLLICWKANHS